MLTNHLGHTTPDFWSRARLSHFFKAGQCRQRQIVWVCSQFVPFWLVRITVNLSPSLPHFGDIWNLDFGALLFWVDTKYYARVFLSHRLIDCAHLCCNSCGDKKSHGIARSLSSTWQALWGKGSIWISFNLNLARFDQEIESVWIQFWFRLAVFFL